MTEGPRHLHDLTAEMPAIPRAPRHAAAPGQPTFTEQIPRIDAERQHRYPPVPAEWTPVRVGPTQREPWWRRVWAWLMGA